MRKGERAMGKREGAMRKGRMGMREREMGKESMKMREREDEDEGECSGNASALRTRKV